MQCNEMQGNLSKNGEREKTLWEKPYPKKRDMFNKEEKHHVTPLVKNPAPPRDLANEDT